MENDIQDKPVAFECQGNSLHGVLSEPKKPFDTAVIIVVGGPQFRVGSHRQFVLLARHLAKQGILALRFDYTGMGYSSGRPKNFFEVDHDINAAVNYVKKEFPQIENLFLWGLCDAASAISFTAYTEKSINGIIILNPWVRSDASHSEAILKSYYRDRIFSWDVWKELLASPSKIFSAIASLTSVCVKVLANVFHSKSSMEMPLDKISIAERQNNLVSSVLTGLTRFNGKICLMLSENDLTADEFKREFDNRGWMNTVENNQKMTMHNVSGADHTFSSADWRAQVEKLTVEFVQT